MSDFAYDPLLLSALDSLLSAEGDAPDLESAPEQATIFRSEPSTMMLIYRTSSLPLLRNLLVEIDRVAQAWRDRAPSSPVAQKEGE